LTGGNLDLMTVLLRGHDAVVYNVLDAAPVLEACLRAGVPKVVGVSADPVYGSVEQGSCGEDSPLRPSSPYAASKAGGDLMALAYFRTHGLDVALVPRLITRLLKNRTVELYGDGSNVRDWVHMEDHCRAIHLVLTAGRVVRCTGAARPRGLRLVSPGR
jgi:dTDP-glucose 4,6-dehydratase